MKNGDLESHLGKNPNRRVWGGGAKRERGCATNTLPSQGVAPNSSSLYAQHWAVCTSRLWDRTCMEPARLTTHPLNNGGEGRNGGWAATRGRVGGGAGVAVVGCPVYTLPSLDTCLVAV